MVSAVAPSIFTVIIFGCERMASATYSTPIA
jgi:hypothetical protein